MVLFINLAIYPITILIVASRVQEKVLGIAYCPYFFHRGRRKANYIIDLHTGAMHGTNLPQIRACLDNEDTLRMAKAFGTPVIIDSAIRDGSLRSEAEKRGIPVCTDL